MRRLLSARSVAVIGLVWLSLIPLARAQSQDKPSDPAAIEFFESKVRPLLAARCHGCHGADKQKGNLRLDSRESILKGGDTSPAIVPGKPDESLLVDAIRYGDTYKMPPKSQLPAEEVATLVEWVRLGAPWGKESPAAVSAAKPSTTFDLKERARHWSFQPIRDCQPPAVGNASWVKTPVDQFILAALESAGLSPAPPSDKRTLLRRVTYDLIGLPPTPEEIKTFLRDDSAGAYARVVDRLLDSPRYGERWARHWLDLVRYAETQGHEFDYEIPNAWQYRDYVIRALNSDLPYDQFVLEHIAGDLLAAPRRNPRNGFNESIIATGFYFLGEAKHSPVDVRQDEADRIDNQLDVFGKAFLGLTIACARCHDHKFDAISTKDYYALAGYLQSSHYQQVYIDPPEKLAQAIAQLKAQQEERSKLRIALAKEEARPRVASLAERLLNPGSVNEQWVKELEIAAKRSDDPFYAWAVLANPTNVPASNFADRRCRLVVELKAQAKLANWREGLLFDFTTGNRAAVQEWRANGPAFGDQSARPLDAFKNHLLTHGAAHSGLFSLKLRGTLCSPTFEITQPKLAYLASGQGGHIRLIVDGLQLIQDPIYGQLKFDLNNEQSTWHVQDVSKWIGHRAYIELVDDGDGYVALEQARFIDDQPPPAPNPLIVAMLDDETITSREELAARYQQLFTRAITNARENDAVFAHEAAVTPDSARASLLNRVLSLPRANDERQSAAADSLRLQLAALDQRQQATEASLPALTQVPAIADGTPENEHVFIRGSHKTMGDEVPRRFLEVLGGARHVAPAKSSGRLELAGQLVSKDNPLVARVIVNRLWQHHFGEGIVRTPDNFGVMGQPPTHPDLLDYLAAMLKREGWSLKKMHRQMLLSATYQMSSQPNGDRDRADPQNKFWHRMAARRLEAETIRDAILAVSSRADLKMHGPGVMPYLTDYMTGRGRPTRSGPIDGQGRRSVYLSVRRNFLPPMFLAFDYPTPFTTIGRRTTSNVPAQALAMMNSLFVIEQAAHWGERVASQGSQNSAQRVRQMYLTALSRDPTADEEQAALEFISDSTAGRNANRAQPWADLAHVLFNLKEFIYIR